MKKALSIYQILVLVFSLIQAASCKKEEPAVLPVVSTTPATNITVSTATTGGTITSNGGATITSNGVCWGINSNPTTDGSKTVDRGSVSQYISNLTGLAGGTTYYVRAYATNSVGTAYGADISFTTLGLAPESLTQSPSDISPTGATLNGTVNANYLSTTVIFEYGTSAIIYGQSVTANQSPVDGNSITNVSVNISGLLPGVTYHYRIKTVNSLGTTYGDDMTFTTLGQAPVVVTQATSSLSSTEATLNGTVNPNFALTFVSFEYGLTTSYGTSITANPGTLTGNNTSVVSAVISGLTPGTTYHFRVKAVNSLGIVYGSDFTFTTLSVAPTLSTASITNITATSAVSGGNITFDGGSPVTARGVCWSISENPDIADNISMDGNGTGEYVSYITGLLPGTKYYFRSYATNSSGYTSYGDQRVSYTYLGNVEDIDGNIYNTIAIGNQIWMAENLKTTKYNNGEPIPNVVENSDWSSFGLWYTKGYCWYNNDISTKDEYGALYKAAIISYYVPENYNICPVGWHVSTHSDWLILMSNLGASFTYSRADYSYHVTNELVLDKLKEVGSNHWPPSNTGTNETLFSAFPVGFRNSDGSFASQESVQFFGALWHLKLENYPVTTLPRARMEYNGSMEISGDGGGLGLPVRCVKD